MKIKFQDFIALMLLCIFALTSCESGQHSRTKQVPVKTYKVQRHNTDDLLYYYVFFANQNYYTYSSSTPVSNFSQVTWQQSSTDPISNITTGNGYTLEQVENVNVDVSDLSEAAQIDVGNDPAFSTQDLSEAGSETGEGTSTQDLSESSSGSDGGGDSGGFDGGGDSGGGDGGDGGE